MDVDKPEILDPARNRQELENFFDDYDDDFFEIDILTKDIYFPKNQLKYSRRNEPSTSEQSSQPSGGLNYIFQERRERPDHCSNGSLDLPNVDLYVVEERLEEMEDYGEANIFPNSFGPLEAGLLQNPNFFDSSELLNENNDRELEQILSQASITANAALMVKLSEKPREQEAATLIERVSASQASMTANAALMVKLSEKPREQEAATMIERVSASQASITANAALMVKLSEKPRDQEAATLIERVSVPGAGAANSDQRAENNIRKADSPDMFAEEQEAIPFESCLQWLVSAEPRSLYQTLVSQERNAETQSQCLVPLSNFRSSVTEDITPNSLRKDQLIRKIEDIVLKFVSLVVNGQPVTVVIRNTGKWENCFYDTNDCTVKLSGRATTKRLSLESGVSSHRFSLICFLLAEVYRLLVTGSSCTTRELYYRHPEFVQNQGKMNGAVRDLACLLDAAPWELGIFSSSKGLIAGSLVITFSNGEILDLSNYSGPTIVPAQTSEIIRLETTAALVLIVEKDTVFESLLQQDILTCLGENILLLTGKGYPDINTRMITKKISNICKIPIYALVDADPYGIDILLVYRHGSRALSTISDSLACPEIRWIGVHPAEIDALQIPYMTLTDDDIKKVDALLEREFLSNDVKNELLIMRSTKKKAEIEGISGVSINFLAEEYIPNKLNRNLSNLCV